MDFVNSWERLKRTPKLSLFNAENHDPLIARALYFNVEFIVVFELSGHLPRMNTRVEC